MDDGSLDPRLGPSSRYLKMFHSYCMLDYVDAGGLQSLSFQAQRQFPQFLETPMALGVADKDVRYHSMDGEGCNGIGTKDYDSI